MRPSWSQFGSIITSKLTLVPKCSQELSESDSYSSLRAKKSSLEKKLAWNILRALKFSLELIRAQMSSL